jgi:hypothetical protein
MQVIDELDQKKDHSRLGDRAKRVIQEISTIEATGGRVHRQHDISLEIFHYDFSSSDFPDTLIPEHPDNRILLTAKKYLQLHSSATIAVYTEDKGMQQRCMGSGIRWICPDSATRLVSPDDELAKQHKKVLAELTQLKSKLPNLDLRLGIVGTNQSNVYPKFELVRAWQMLDATVAVTEVRSKYKPYVIEAQRDHGHIRERMFESLLDANTRRNYNKLLDDYFEQVRIYFADMNAWGELQDRAFSFDLWLHNNGGGPATDVDVAVTFPQIITYVTEHVTGSDKCIQRPKPPVPPEKPQIQIIGQLDLKSLYPHPSISQTISDLFSKHNEPTRGVRICKTPDGRQTIQAKFERLKQHTHYKLGTFDLAFADWLDIKSFEAETTFSAVELPEFINGKINFVVRTQ